MTGVATVPAKREHEWQLALARPSGDSRRRDVEQPCNIGASQVPPPSPRAFHPPSDRLHALRALRASASISRPHQSSGSNCPALPRFYLVRAVRDTLFTDAGRLSRTNPSPFRPRPWGAAPGSPCDACHNNRDPGWLWFRAVGEMGFLGAKFPEEYGGAGADSTSVCIFISSEILRAIIAGQLGL